MLVIRLTRKGKKNQPFFRVVAIDKRRSSKGGRAVEDLGYLDPLKKRISLKKERILYWLSKGVQPSATMHNLLVSEKIIDAKKINVSKKSKKPAPSTTLTPAPVVEPTPAAEAVQPESQIEPEKPAEQPPSEAPKEEPKAEAKSEEPKVS